MTDEQLIAEGRKYAREIQRCQLELGKLALEFAPIGEPSVKVGSYDRLREYAAAIGVDEGTLRNYRTVAHAWAQANPPQDFGFTVLKALTSVARKEDLVAEMTAVEPPAASQRWTVQAATDFARERGYWSHDGTRPKTVLTALRRVRGSIARLGDADLTPEEIRDVVGVIKEVQMELVELVERLQAHDGPPA